MACVYKGYGDLKVFRCGDKMRIFGVVVEDISVVSFDNLVVILEISEHEYESAGITREQADDLAREYGQATTETEFFDVLDARILDAGDLRELL
jgi:hypothetical protein